MEPRKHRTPSGLPPSNFEEGADVWDFVKKPQNELELILKHGVWAPQPARLKKQRQPATRNSRTAGSSLFAANSPQLSAPQLITWWEKRRLAYNGVLLGAGAFTLCLLWLTTFAFSYKMDGLSDAISRGDTLLDPHALVWLLIAANAVFTLGCGIDVLSHAMRRYACHARQSASLLRAALWVSLICIGLISVSLLHFAIAR